MKGKALSFLLVVLMSFNVVGLAACDKNKGLDGQTESVIKTDEEQIEETIAKFSTKYNEGDFEGVLGCMTAKTGNAMRAMFNLLGGIAGGKLGVDISLSDLFSLGVATSEGDFIGLTVTRIVVTDAENAIAAVKMNLTGGNPQTVYFEMRRENSCWLINDITDKNSLPGENLGEGGVQVTEMTSNFIRFSQGGNSYRGYVNGNGEIFYYHDASISSTYTAIGEGAGYIEEAKSQTQSTYRLFNAQGQNTATFTKEDFDEVIGYGGGMLLVYKNTSTVSVEEHSYGVIDATDGTWEKPLTASREIPANGGVSSLDCWRYCGEGLWGYYEYYGNCEHYTFYNATANTTFAVEDCSLANVSFVNGVLYGRNTWDGKLYAPHDAGEGESLPAYFILQSNGQVTEIEEFQGGICGEVLVDTSGEYITLKNLKKNTTATYTNFSKEKLSGYLSYENYIVLFIDGADGKQYMTVIDDQAEEQFAPKQIYGNYNAWGGYYQNIYLSEGRIVYQENENFYTVMDMQGNTLVADGRYSKINAYANGYAYAESENGTYYLGLDGNPLTFKLTNN